MAWSMTGDRFFLTTGNGEKQLLNRKVYLPGGWFGGCGLLMPRIELFLFHDLDALPKNKVPVMVIIFLPQALLKY